MTVNHRPITVPRLPNGQFDKGQPGRAKGAKGREAIARLNELKATAGPLALVKLVELVEQGNWKATAYVLDRILPSGGRTLELESTAPADIAAALAEGSITPDEAAKIATALNTLASAQEVRDLMQRLDALEAKFGIGGSSR